MKNKSESKLIVIKIIFIAIGIVFVGRLFMLQVLDHDRFLSAADNQQNLIIDIQAKRGSIYDRNLKVLAQDIDSYSYYVVPGQIINKNLAARKLKNITGSANWLEKFKKHPRFLWVTRKADKRLERTLEQSNIESLNRIVEPRRVYPAGKLALSLLGRVDIDVNGLSGIELQYDELLSGKNGKAILKRDGLGQSYFFDERPLVEPCSGADIVLTLDLDLQQIVEQEMTETLMENNAAGGIALFIKVDTGEILACAVLDSLGKPSARNRAVTDQYEPGSTFKIITVATAISQGLFEPNNILFVENGKFRIGRRTIRDDHEFDSLTVEDIVVHSSNIGASKIALELGDELLFKAIKEAGFVMPLGIDFPAEASGYLPRPDWRQHYLANVSFGHGVSATPLQIISLYGAIASGGFLYRPFIGKEVIGDDGTRKPLAPRLRIRRVFSEDITETIGEFLKQVVIRGTAHKASSRLVSIAGKTGTALKLREDKKGYDQKRARSSFVGYFPAEDPAIVGMTLFDEPKNSRYGGETAAPVFKNIAERYYCLPQFMVERMLASEQNRQEQAELPTGDSQSEFVKILEVSARYCEDPSDEGLIPNFKGLTMKQAMTLAVTKGIECELNGSGMVYSQTPSAGKKYIQGNTVKLGCKSW